MMIEEPFQRALKLEVFANTIRRDLSDLLHVSNISPTPLNITSEALGPCQSPSFSFPQCFLYSMVLLLLIVHYSIIYLNFLLRFVFTFSGYEVPFVCRLDEVNRLYDEKALTTAEVKFEIDRLLRRDFTRLHGNDPFAMK
jgi:hypothetical protein